MNKMRYGSICSGIEAASVAWEPLGWEAQWFSEIDQFPSDVLKHRYPAVPNLGDMTKLNSNETFINSTIDVLVGGTPCQSFSVAGLRKGLADPRGNLMLTFLSLADAKKPRWVIWENVPGVLSSNGGKDFGTFLGALGELGYGFAYRVLDAQYFGVAQRRRRVFVVGYLGDWRPAAAVLFESESLQRDSKPSRKKGQETPTDVEEGIRNTGDVRSTNIDTQPVHVFKVRGGCDGGGKGYLGEDEKAFTISAMQDQQVAQPIALASKQYSQNIGNNIANPLLADDYKEPQVVAQPIAVDWRTAQVDVDKTGTLKTELESKTVAGFLPTQGSKAQGIGYAEEQSPTLRAGCDNYGVLQTMAIRRLTPKECERLQGFPDDWTMVPYRNKPADQCPDGPRYKACGNSMAVPVMRWIGQRIDMINKMI